MNKTAVVILAAGRSRRMGRGVIKPLLPLAGREMISHVIDTARTIRPAEIVVVASPELARHDGFRAALGPARCVVQDPPAGTGDACRRGLDAVPGFDGTWIVLLADMPLIRAGVLRALRRAVDSGADLALGTVRAGSDESFADYGRVILDDDAQPKDVIEAVHLRRKDRSSSLACIGAMAFAGDGLARYGEDRDPRSSGGEWYLTALPAAVRRRRGRVVAVDCPPEDALGVNRPQDWWEVQGRIQDRLRAGAMARGVWIEDPATVRLSWDTRIGSMVRIGAHVTIEPGVRIGTGSRIEGFCSLADCAVGRGCRIGPFARLRPGAVIGDDARIGNYVEIKNSRIGKGSKVSHLSYIGDAVIGARVNIGAGTITCNYDGAGKHRTRIGDGAFIGSNASLVAPLRIGAGALIGAGSVITRDVGAGMLATARADQETRPLHPPRKRGMARR